MYIELVPSAHVRNNGSDHPSAIIDYAQGVRLSGSHLTSLVNQGPHAQSHLVVLKVLPIVIQNSSSILSFEISMSIFRVCYNNVIIRNMNRYLFIPDWRGIHRKEALCSHSHLGGHTGVLVSGSIESVC